MRITTKVIIGVVSLVVIVVTVTGAILVYYSLNFSTRLVLQVQEEKLNAIRDTKKFNVEHYFAELEKTAVALATSTLVIDASEALASFFSASLENDSTRLQIMGDSEYQKAHKYYHRRFKNISNSLNKFVNLYLIDLAQDKIVYNLKEEQHLSGQVLPGTQSQSALAEGYLKAKQKKKPIFLSSEDVFLLALPVYKQKEAISILVLKVDKSKLNSIVSNGFNWREEGLGRTGETYLVDKEYNLLTKNRFPEKAAIHDKKINTLAVKKALAGEIGFAEGENYAGELVFTSYSFIKVFEESWAILTEIDRSEDLEVINELEAEVLKATLIITLAAIIFSATIGWVVGVNLAKKLRTAVRVVLEMGGNLIEKEQDTTLSLDGFEDFQLNLDNMLVKLQDDDELDHSIGILTNKIIQQAKDISKHSKMYQVLLDTIDFAVFIHDSDFNIRFCNKKYCQYAGFSNVQDVLGKKYYHVFPVQPHPLNSCQSDSLNQDPQRCIRTRNQEINLASGRKLLSNVYPVIEDGYYAYSIHLLEEYDPERLAKQSLSKLRDLLLLRRELSWLVATSKKDEDDVIKKAIAMIGEFYNAARCYVFHYDKKNKAYSCAHEWTERGVAAYKDTLQGISVKDLPWFTEQLFTFNQVVVDSVDKLKINSAEKLEWSRQGIKSLLCLPLYEEGDIIGFIGLDIIEQESSWENEDVDCLKGISRLVESLLVRKKFDLQEKAHRRQLEGALINAIEAMSSAVEVRDPYTAGHQHGVASLAKKIAEKMNLSLEQIRAVFLGGLIHDVGKIYIPSEILSYPGRLSEEQYSLVKTHPEQGARIFEHIDFPWPIKEVILQHHERINGGGYPKKLLGKDITLEAKIVAVADVVEAMSTRRPYREGLGVDVALKHIRDQSGILYEPAVVAACIEVFEEDGFEFNK